MARPDGGEEPVVIGRVLRIHGLRGELLTALHGGDASRLERMGSVEIEHGSERRAYEIEGARPHKGGGLVKLKGIDDADSAERLVGGVLTIPAARLPVLESGTYYHFQLVGLSVRDEGGSVLGEIADVMGTGGADLLVVRAGDREHLIPAVGEIVRSVDLVAGVVVVRLPEGLLDL